MSRIINEQFSGNAATATTLTSTTGLVLFFQPNGFAASGNYLVSNVGAAGNQNFNLTTPVGFTTLLSAVLIASTGSAGAVGAGKSITLNSSFALLTALKTTNAQTSSPTITIPALNTFFTIDVTAVLSGLAANSGGGIKITHNAIGGSVDYYGLKLIYN